MQRDKISKQKCSSHDPVSFRSLATKTVGALPPSNAKKSKGKSFKQKAKNVLDCQPSKSSDSGVPFDDIEMEIALSQNESPDASKKACNKNEKLATSSKQLDGDVASVKENSKGNSSSPNGVIQTKEGDDGMDEDIGDEYDIPATESEEDERVEASKKSQSESDLCLETTEDDTSQEEQEVKEGKTTVDNEEEGSTAESDEDENNESSCGESEHLTAKDFVDQEAEEGSETDDDEEESIFESEITLSSDEEKKEALFEGGSRISSETAAKKSDQRYNESDDMGSFIVDDDFIEPMSDDEAADLPDECSEDDARTKKHRRIVTLPDSSDSEASEIESGLAPQRGRKPQSEKASQSSVKATGARNKLQRASEGKQAQDPNLELSSAKSKRKKLKDEMHLPSEQEASSSKVPREDRIVDDRAQQFYSRFVSSKVPFVSRPVRSPKLASPVRPRLSRLDEFRISKGLSPALKRRETRDGSENWVVSDVHDSIKTSAADSSPPRKKYAKLVTLSKKEDADNACLRVLKRSRCESESPIPRKKSRR